MHLHFPVAHKSLRFTRRIHCLMEFLISLTDFLPDNCVVCAGRLLDVRSTEHRRDGEESLTF